LEADGRVFLGAFHVQHDSPDLCALCAHGRLDCGRSIWRTGYRSKGWLAQWFGFADLEGDNSAIVARKW